MRGIWPMRPSTPHSGVGKRRACSITRGKGIMRTIWIVLALLTVALVTQGQERPDKPTYSINHDADQGHPQLPPHRCGCHRMCDPTHQEDPQCQTYCTPERCLCKQACGES